MVTSAQKFDIDIAIVLPWKPSEGLPTKPTLEHTTHKFSDVIKLLHSNLNKISF